MTKYIYRIASIYQNETMEQDVYSSDCSAIPIGEFGNPIVGILSIRFLSHE